MTTRHRGVNRPPNLPAPLREFFRATSKQEWAEIAFDLAQQLNGGDEAQFSDIRADLETRRALARRRQQETL